ncbi:MAG TPA: hypothetical protein P5543_05530 [Planctomycetota bacterium]|nr:hypothetical protein [Planctomycetota bacterium]
MEWKQGTIQDALNTWSFSAQYSLSYISVESVDLKIGENWHDLSDLYKKIGDDYIKVNYNINENLFNFNFYKNLLNFIVFTRTHKYNDTINLEEVNIRIKFKIAHFSHYSDYKNYKGNTTTIDCEVKINNAKDLAQIDFLNGDKRVDFWIPVGETSPFDLPLEYFDSPNFENVQVGDKYYYPPYNSICEVVKKYDYSDTHNSLYDIKLTDGTIVTIKDYNRSTTLEGEIYDYLLVLPFAEIKTKYDILNKAMNESTLQPYVSYEDKTYNVYWQEVNNVAKYIVSVYKIIKFSNKPNTYHLKDIEVNKNEKIAVIDGLVGGNFVFVVKALDRDNNTLTLSRGILNEG